MSEENVTNPFGDTVAPPTKPPKTETAKPQAAITDSAEEFCKEFAQTAQAAAYMKSQMPKKREDIDGFLNEFAPNPHRRGVMQKRLEEIVKD